MFWDMVASVYDLFETVYNGKVYREIGEAVAEYIQAGDTVLECACGTGEISRAIAPVCAHLLATDFSENMLRRAARKLQSYPNVEVRKADLTALEAEFAENSFDKVVAGNVIHLLEDPAAALRGLMRVCRPGGNVIIPTYINRGNAKASGLVKLFDKAGAHFQRQFDLAAYRMFFSEAGCENVEYRVIDGRMPCVVAVITK